jgi:hypothetical protein
MILYVTIGFGFEASSQGTHSLSFTEVVDSLDLDEKTSLYVKQYWLEIRDQEVTWSGEVKNVKGGRGKAELRVANKARSTYKGFNMVLVSYDVETAAKFEIGQQIKFTGSLYKYKSRKGRPIIIYLNEVEFK